MEYSWAVQFPELHKILTLFQLTHLSNPIRYRYKSIPSILQDGPQCGLVALAMCRSENQNETLKFIFELAKQQDFTFNGEIFSVQYMANLAKECLKNCEIDEFEGDINCNIIEEFLLDGGMMLVPYDTNKDNSPGFHKGHKAHWTLISGGIQTNNGFFVTARHGKAQNVAVWDLKTLGESNKQLFEFSPDRKLQNVQYKLPEGGINGPCGLNGKSVLIKYL